MIDYQSLIDEAVLGIIKRILAEYAIRGPQYNQCFYITFDTCHPQVKISSRVKKKHPNHITIILENQFDNLLIFDDHFTVNLVFGGVKENILVPFAAIISFMDPIANFSLQLQHDRLYENELIKDKTIVKGKLKTDSRKLKDLQDSVGAEIIDFSNFRKKK
jgi:hypothetical protein